MSAAATPRLRPRQVPSATCSGFALSLLGETRILHRQSFDNSTLPFTTSCLKKSTSASIGPMPEEAIKLSLLQVLCRVLKSWFRFCILKTLCHAELELLAGSTKHTCGKRFDSGLSSTNCLWKLLLRPDPGNRRGQFTSFLSLPSCAKYKTSSHSGQGRKV